MLLYLKRQVSICAMLIILVISAKSYSQEFPPLEIFTPQTYGAADQNWSISQDANEIIYIANNKGLLEYNGAKWKLYPTPNETILRSVEVIDDIVYTGSYMDFGFWKRNEFGLLVYKSFSDKINGKLVEDEEIWEIVGLENWVLFQSFDRIYIYNINDDKFKIIESETRIDKIFKVGDAIYFQKINQGIYKIEKGKEELLTSDIKIKDKEIVNIFLKDKELLFQTREDGFYKYSNKNFQKWKIEANTLLSQVSVYNSIKLKDGSFVLGTISKGLIHLNAKGQVVLRIDQSEGLSNNTVLSVFEDRSGDVWLGLDNGINTLNLDSPFKIYRDNLGVLGTVYTSAKTDSNLYLGTNQGLFYRQLGAKDKFKFIEGTKGQVWSLQNVNGTLFCGHDKGTFVIENDTANEVSNERGTWFVKEIEGKADILIQGNYRGLYILEKDKDTWKLRNKIDGFDISSRYFEFINSKEILMSHEYKGVYKLQLDDQYSKVVKFKIIAVDKGISSSIVDYNNKLYYVYEDRIFCYNNEDNTLKRDSVLSSLFLSKKYVSSKLINDEEGNRLWSFSNDQMLYVEPGKLTDKPEIHAVPLSSESRKSKLGFENILHLDNNNYLLGTTEGYMIIDLNKVEDKSYNIELNTVSYNTLQKEMIPLKVDEHKDLENKENSIHFTYSVADFNKFSTSFYQHRLLGIYDNWSAWSNDSEALFENLPFGDYKFEARAKVGGKISDNTVLYSFYIAKPWYLKPLAILLYVLLFVFITLLIQFLNRRYYKKQRQSLIQKKEREIEFKELENQKQLMQFKNTNLQLDIENKNRELGMSTMNLINKNELLNSLKKELSNTKKVEDLKSVVKLIDKNLNTTDDWKLFEEAFNNADKDFLKKLKSVHPGLTSNDLRLCTYLRLNLSSKEIAPLLNISHKSVEVKRYRLRKKMNLSHDINLTNYILEM